MKTKITTLALAATLLLSTHAKAQDGSLDLSFGTNGIATTSFGNGNDFAQDMSLQPDGKILLAGYSRNGANDDFALVRYNSDGSLDLSFGTNGKVTTAIGNGDDHCYAMDLQPDGKILLAGHNGTNADMALVRYNSDGSLDLSFDTDGIVTTAIGNGLDQARAISIQPDGKILLGGYSSSASALVRYNSDGSLDLSFDTDGIVTTNITNGTPYIFDMGLQPDGKILLAGSANYGGGSCFTLIRYNSDGSLDPSFAGGITITSIGVFSAYAYTMTLQPDGKILLAGTADNGGSYDFALIRYNSNGSLDLIVTTPIIGNSNDYARAISLQPNGKILLAGDSYGNGLALVRYNSNGIIDYSFDTDGKVTTEIGNSVNYARAMCLQPDEKILVAGYFFNGASYDFALVRYNNNTMVPTNTIQDAPQNITIYPNPFSDATTIQFPLTTNDAELSIYNMFGQKVKTISNISDATITLNRNELSSGFHVLSLTQNKKVVATGKMVVVD